MRRRACVCGFGARGRPPCCANCPAVGGGTGRVWAWRVAGEAVSGVRARQQAWRGPGSEWGVGEAESGAGRGCDGRRASREWGTAVGGAGAGAGCQVGAGRCWPQAHTQPRAPRRPAPAMQHAVVSFPCGATARHPHSPFDIQSGPPGARTGRWGPGLGAGSPPRDPTPSARPSPTRTGLARPPPGVAFEIDVAASEATEPEEMIVRSGLAALCFCGGLGRGGPAPPARPPARHAHECPSPPAIRCSAPLLAGAGPRSVGRHVRRRRPPGAGPRHRVCGRPRRARCPPWRRRRPGGRDPRGLAGAFRRRCRGRRRGGAPAGPGAGVGRAAAGRRRGRGARPACGAGGGVGVRRPRRGERARVCCPRRGGRAGEAAEGGEVGGGGGCRLQGWWASRRAACLLHTPEYHLPSTLSSPCGGA